MPLTEHYDLFYLDADEEISEFPGTWDYTMDKIDKAIHDASANDDVAASRVTGTLNAARIPNIAASKTTTGTFADARIPSTIARTAEVDRSTGPRKINSLIVDGGELSGVLGIARIGAVVTIYASNLKMDGSGSAQLCTLPPGFRAPANMKTEWCGRGGATEYFDLYDSGSVWAGRLGPGKAHTGVITYITTDSWPSSLPGDPA